MKRSELERIASVVGKLFRSYVVKFAASVDQLVGRVTTMEQAAAKREQEFQQRCAEIVAAEVEKLRGSIKIPTAEQVAKLVPVPVVPSKQEIAAEARSLIEVPPVPKSEDVVAQVVELLQHKLPTAEEVLAMVPDAPTKEEIVAAVVKLLTIPTAEEVAKLVVVPIPTVPTVEQIVAAVPKPELPVMPTKEQIAEHVMTLVKVPTAEEVAKLVVVPKPEDIAALVPRAEPLPAPSSEQIAKSLKDLIILPSVPTAEEIAKHVPTQAVPSIAEIVAAVPKPELPVMPTKEQIAEHVMTLVKVPTAEEVAKLVVVPIPTVPTVEQIVAALPVPSADEISQKVLTLVPRAADIVSQVMQLVKIPTAKEIAAEVHVPEPAPIELPHVPTVDEVIDGLKKHIPAPLKGDPGASVAIEDVAPIVEGNFAKWALEFERRAADQVQRFLASIKSPDDGKDGFGFDDMSLDYDGERTVTITFAREGKTPKSFSLDLPIVIYRGVWKDGEYERGDCVTWDGCTWIAKGETEDKPGQSDDWQLAVKKGRDGRDSDDPKKTPTRVRVAPRGSGGGA